MKGNMNENLFSVKSARDEGMKLHYCREKMLPILQWMAKIVVAVVQDQEITALQKRLASKARVLILEAGLLLRPTKRARRMKAACLS